MSNVFNYKVSTLLSCQTLISTESQNKIPYITASKMKPQIFGNLSYSHADIIELSASTKDVSEDVIQ